MNSLDANIRNNKTKGELNSLRNNGMVPAIIYGGEAQNEKVSISKKLLKILIEKDNFLSNIVTLNLVGHELTSLPESLCSIYKNLKYFDVSNNSICPPYPNCFEFMGFQNTSRCADKTSMSNQDSNYSLIDNRNIIFNNKYNKVNLENFQFDLSVIQEFINILMEKM